MMYDMDSLSSQDQRRTYLSTSNWQWRKLASAHVRSSTVGSSGVEKKMITLNQEHCQAKKPLWKRFDGFAHPVSCCTFSTGWRYEHVRGLRTAARARWGFILLHAAALLQQQMTTQAKEWSSVFLNGSLFHCSFGPGGTMNFYFETVKIREEAPLPPLSWANLVQLFSQHQSINSTCVSTLNKNRKNHILFKCQANLESLIERVDVKTARFRASCDTPLPR